MAKLRGLRKAHFITHLHETQWQWNRRYDHRYNSIPKNLALHPLNEESPLRK